MDRSQLLRLIRFETARFTDLLLTACFRTSGGEFGFPRLVSLAIWRMANSLLLRVLLREISFRLHKTMRQISGWPTRLLVSFGYHRKMMSVPFPGQAWGIWIMRVFWLLMAGWVGCGLDLFRAASPISPAAKSESHIQTPMVWLQVESATFTSTIKECCGSPLRAGSAG